MPVNFQQRRRRRCLDEFAARPLCPFFIAKSPVSSELREAYILRARRGKPHSLFVLKMAVRLTTTAACNKLSGPGLSRCSIFFKTPAGLTWKIAAQFHEHMWYVTVANQFVAEQIDKSVKKRT